MTQTNYGINLTIAYWCLQSDHRTIIFYTVSQQKWPLADFLITCNKVYRIEHNFMNTYPYVLQRIMQSFWKIHLSVTEKSNRKQNHINVRLYNYSITTCSQSYNDNVKIWCSKWPPFSRIQYYSPMKSGVSADSSSATILRARWAGALSCWNAKKGPDIERMAGKRCCHSSVFQ